MEQEDLVNVIFGILGLALASMAIVSSEYRAYAIVAAVVMIFAAVVWRNYSEIDRLITTENKLRENLNIHRQLIDIKADIKCMKRGKK